MLRLELALYRLSSILRHHIVCIKSIQRDDLASRIFKEVATHIVVDPNVENSPRFAAESASSIPQARARLRSSFPFELKLHYPPCSPFGLVGCSSRVLCQTTTS